MKEEKKTGSGKGSLILTFVLAAVITFAGLYHFNVQELFLRHEEQLPNIGEVAHREVEAAGPKPVSSEAEDPGVAGEQEPINEVYSVIALTLDPARKARSEAARVFGAAPNTYEKASCPPQNGAPGRASTSWAARTKKRFIANPVQITNLALR